MTNTQPDKDFLLGLQLLDDSVWEKIIKKYCKLPFKLAMS